jgi:hypothetical protein
MTIRHLQKLVVFVALTLAAVLPILRLSLLALPIRLLVLALILPPLLLCAAAALLRRGPIKDWTYQLLANVSMLGLAISMGGALVLATGAGPAGAGPSASTIILLWLLFAVLIGVELVHYAPRLFPRLCPVCRRPAVLPDRRGRRRYSHLCLCCQTTFQLQKRRLSLAEVSTGSEAGAA